MFRSLRTPIALAITALVSAAPAAIAQYVARGHGNGPVEDVIAEPPVPVPGVAALALEHAAELSLAASQRATLESIRHAQDSADAPWLRRLDSLRPTHWPANPNDLSQEQRDEIAARHAAIDQVMNGMRGTDSLSREHALAALDPEQRRRAADLEKDARKRADEERRRRAREGFRGTAVGLGRSRED